VVILPGGQVDQMNGGSEAAALADLYEAFRERNLAPLWTEIANLMPTCPAPRAQAHHWSWPELYRLAQRSADLVPVGRGGERRAIALANPGLAGLPFATPTLWAAIQYLGPGEDAPEHRHSQNAFRFVLEGEGVWTVVDGDPVAMRRGDLLLTPGFRFHGHHNVAREPMAWLDGLDIPLVHHIDAGFFETGSEGPSVRDTPARCRAERVWGHPGLIPTAERAPKAASPLVAYRWEHTNRALDDQLELEDAGYHDATFERSHAAVTYTNPVGGDILPTIRAEFHRLRAGARTQSRREVGSSVWQVFQGAGMATIGDVSYRLVTGDLFAVPSWKALQIQAEVPLDLFRFSDAPVFEALGFARVELDESVAASADPRRP